MKSKKFSFFDIYSDCFKYVCSCRIQIYSVIFLFFLFALLGFFIPISKEIMGIILKYIEEILQQTSGMSTSQLIYFIFLNNLRASLLGVVLGLFFGIFPIVLAAVNGYVLGVVAFLSVSQNGFLSLANLFPHGIFELPAIFISLGLGLNLGTFLFQKKIVPFLKTNLLNSLKVFLFVVVPLLIVAAIIEGTIIILFG